MDFTQVFKKVDKMNIKLHNYTKTTYVSFGQRNFPLSPGRQLLCTRMLKIFILHEALFRQCNNGYYVSKFQYLPYDPPKESV